MRELHVRYIEDTVMQLLIKANRELPQSIVEAVKVAQLNEQSKLAKEVCDDLLLNIETAKKLDIPLCQDTGMAVVFVELGQDVHLIGGGLEDAINKGVSKAYINGNLRSSIVEDPLTRTQNTGDNTPAIIHLNLVEGEHVKISVFPKGFGSENMSKLKMFTPSATTDEIKEFIVSVVKDAGGNPCPPIIVGVGIGGNFEHSAYLAKKALCRNITLRNKNKFYANLETDLLNQINALGIGPQGFGGLTTAFAVNIEYAPTHIAGLPVAVNIGCYMARSASVVI
ncbi:MAG: fumarate hydratase [Ruminococcaceae bacterium]|nr:fumarate hydratase [Oscillospiraceae bacterium]